MIQFCCFKVLSFINMWRGLSSLLMSSECSISGYNVFLESNINNYFKLDHKVSVYISIHIFWEGNLNNFVAEASISEFMNVNRT